MLQLTEAKCSNATNHHVFKSQNLSLTKPLSPLDINFLCKYIEKTHLTSLELRLIITSENSKELMKLSQVIKKKHHLEHVTFMVEAIKVPPKDRSLKIIGSRVVFALIHMLENKPYLKRIDIDLKKLPHPVTKLQAEQLAHHISKLSLEEVNLGVAVVKGARLPIFDLKKKTETLRHFSLSGCSYGNDALNHLVKTHQLTHIKFDKIKFSTDDLQTLYFLLKSNRFLTELCLSRSNLAHIQSHLFFNALKGCVQLKSLDLSFNNLNRLNTNDLCDYLCNPTCQLVILDISNNRYTDNNISQIALALETNTCLEHLIINHNRIEETGVRAIIKLLKQNSKITKLSMSYCLINPSDNLINELCHYLQTPECVLKELEFEQDLSATHTAQLTKAILANRSLNAVRMRFDCELGPIYKARIQKHLHGHVIEKNTQEVLDIVEMVHSLHSGSHHSGLYASQRFFPFESRSISDADLSAENWNTYTDL